MGVDYTTTNCSCTGTATATGVSVVDDLTKPLTFGEWSYSRHATNVCSNKDASGNPKQCSQTLTDSFGNTTVVKTPLNQKLIDLATVTHPVTSYAQKITATWGALGNIALNTGQPGVCSVTACTETSNKCTPTTTAGTTVGSTGQCSYISKAVTNYPGAASPVQIEVVGTWNGSGTGNAVLRGAAITSGNYQGQGTIEFIENSTAVTNAVLGGLGGSGMNGSGTPATVTRAGWTDMKE